MAPRERTTRDHGVTFHKRTHKWEAHVWYRERNRQVYLGSYDSRERAVRVSDLGLLVFKGADANTNRWAGEYAGVDTQALRELLNCGDTAACVSAIRGAAATIADTRDTALLYTVPTEMLLEERMPVWQTP